MHLGSDPVETLVAVAREHAVYCRREVAGVLMTLRVAVHRTGSSGRAG